MHTYSTCCAAAGVFYGGRGLGSSVLVALACLHTRAALRAGDGGTWTLYYFIIIYLM